MTTFYNALRSWHRVWLVARCTIVFSVGSLIVLHAQSDPAVTPGSKLQYASLTGFGNTIMATRVPVVNAKGQIIYQDITFQIDVDSDGNVMLTNGFPLIAPSPNLQVASFQVGKYIGPRTVGNGKAFITVSGPGVANGGSTTWTALSNAEADVCTYPGSATWYVGPIDNNPVVSRLKKLGITSTAWSYGVSGNAPSAACPGSVWTTWGNGSLIGVSQSGNTITIASFSSFGVDSSSPVDQVTYVIVP